MNFITIFLIAIGLSMDSLAVSISGGIFMKKFQSGIALKIALIMGGFQGFMTLFGWILGSRFSQYIADYDHWVAFGLLVYLGGKMLYESLTKEESSFASLSNKTLLLLGIATSIDALAVGISMAFLNSSILYPVIIIGITTFVLSLSGVCCGIRFGRIRNFNAELLGGIILIGIGIKILIEHLFFS